MTMRSLVSAIALTSSGCLLSHDYTCEGGGERGGPLGLCICPEGTVEQGRACEPIEASGSDSGFEEDAGDSPADDAAVSCGDCDADADAEGIPIGADAGDAGDAALDAGDACAVLVWFADCDGDGYAVPRAESTMACEAPPGVGTCAAWTRTEPRAGATDCNDQDPRYRPGAGYGLAGDGDGDLNCDGEVQREGVLRECSVSSSGNGQCNICQSGQQCDCVFDQSGNLFRCSQHEEPDPDWVLDFAWKTNSCTVLLPTPVPRRIGLQYCR